MSNIQASINVLKIDKAYLSAGKNGAKYLSFKLRENKNGKDQFGNDGFITQEIPKDQRKEGVRGPIIGNYKVWENSGYNAHNQSKANGYAPDDEDIDF